MDDTNFFASILSATRDDDTLLIRLELAMSEGFGLEQPAAHARLSPRTPQRDRLRRLYR